MKRRVSPTLLLPVLIVSIGSLVNVREASAQSDAVQQYGLEWKGDGATRHMLYWHNPFPIYDATYVFKVYPRKKVVPSQSPTGYYTMFFWGNDGTFHLERRQRRHVLRRTSIPQSRHRTGRASGKSRSTATTTSPDSQVQWDRWYTQVFRAWRVSSSRNAPRVLLRLAGHLEGHHKDDLRSDLGEYEPTEPSDRHRASAES